MQKKKKSGVLKKAQTKGDKTTKCDKVMDELITEHHTPQGDKNIACSSNLIFFFFLILVIIYVTCYHEVRSALHAACRRWLLLLLLWLPA